MTRTAFVKLFLRERAKFARLYPWVGAVGLDLTDRHFKAHPGLRDFGWYDSHARVVVFLARILRQPPRNILGLVRHELGHAADRNLSRAGAEQRADDLAERATGRVIRYDRRDVQTTGAGVYPRPRYLHR